MTTTLTERYIAAAVASIPPSSRDDVQAELDVSIADAIDARIDQGEGRADAERAVLERTGGVAALPKWSVDRLPELPEKGVGRADMVTSLAFLALGAGALLWDQFRGFVLYNGELFPVLNPDLWPWWIVGLLVLIAAEAALAIAVYRSGGWNTWFAVINTVIALAFAIPAIALLATAQLVNPDLIAAALTDNGVDADTLRTLAIIVGAGIITITGWDIIDGWLKTIRNNRR